MSTTETTPKKKKQEKPVNNTSDIKEKDDVTSSSATSSNTTSTIDPDIAKLHSLSEQEQLWFFIDDVVPTPQKDTEVTIIENGMTDTGFPLLTLAPKSMEIFEEIANIPAQAAKNYPKMVKYFNDIKHLYDDIVRQDINPYWSTEVLEPATPASIQMLLGIHQNALQGFLSLTPKPNSIPFRLVFGEESHKHDFVGIVYLYVK